MSTTANFELENKVYEIAADKKYSPQIYETDKKTYRVEEFYSGPAFHHYELAEAKVLK